MEPVEHLPYSPRRQTRMISVMILYRFELFQIQPTEVAVFEIEDFDDLFNYQQMFKIKPRAIWQQQVQVFSVLSKNYRQFRLLIQSFIRTDWSWSRLSPIIRSILLLACVELQQLDLGIVANEYIEIAKDFIPDSDSYKFINRVIQQIDNLYHEQRIKALKK